VDADVVVIGAGASGLACARVLVGAGLDVIVVEARDRIGGRIHTLREGGEIVEVGAHVVHGDRAVTLSILEEAGLAVAPLDPAEIVVWIDGRPSRIPELAAGDVLPPWSLEEFLVRVDKAEGSVADLFDALPLAAVERRIGEDWLLQTWGAPAAELSAAELAALKRASTAGGGQFVVVAGYDELAARLAHGIDVRLELGVRRIAVAARSVEVGGERGESLRARSVVVTVPPAVVVGEGIDFHPALQPAKLESARQLPLCDAIVVVIRVATPAGRSSWDFVVGPLGGYWQTRASSRFRVGVVKGLPAQRVRDLVRREAFPAVLTRLLPGPAADEVEDVHVVDWGADQFSLGAFTYPAAGARDAARAWAAPIGTSLFFAGEATCWERHRGLVHGALESGRRCADEVLASVRGGQRVASR
jgi:monoamine oxidase